MKKLLPAIMIGTVLAVLVLAFWIYPSEPGASPRTLPEKADGQIEITVQTLSAGMIPEPTLNEQRGIQPLSADNAYHEAYNDLYYAMSDTRATCSLTRYQLNRESVSILFSDVMNHSPELFYVDGRLGISYNKTTGIVSSVTFTYTMSSEEIGQASDFYQSEIDRILNLLPDPGMSNLDIALWIHDYICDRYAYDSELTNYDAYTFFRDRKGACQGYTLAYMALMKSCGIRTDFAASSDMNHIWNLIELDGEWYHVDLTWDDPVHSSGSNIPGRAGHDNFLCSDQALVKTGHYNWTAYTCSSTLYDGTYLDTIQTALAYLDGRWYCVDRQDGGVRVLLFPTMEVKHVFKVEGVWYRWDDSRYYAYSYVNLCTVNGKLCYSMPSAIGCFNPATGTHEVLTDYTGAAGYIYALYAEGSTLHYVVSTAPSGAEIFEYTYEIEDPGTDPTIPPTSTTPEPPKTLEPSDDYVDYLNLTCGEDPAVALISTVNFESGQSMRVLMIANVSRLSTCADPVFSVVFAQNDAELFRYQMEGEDLVFYQSLIDGRERFTAAEGYMLFGVTIDGIPAQAWSKAWVTLADGVTEQILCSHTVENGSE